MPLNFKIIGRMLAEFDDRLTRFLIEKITITESYLTVTFKSGVEIEVES